MNALRCMSMRAWLALMMLATLCGRPYPHNRLRPPHHLPGIGSVVGARAGPAPAYPEGLRALGFDPGSPDGLFGPRTRKAIGGWQSSQGKPASGYLDGESASVLLEADEAPPPPAQETLEILSEALRTARGITEAGKRVWALSEVAPAQAEAGDSHGAARTISDALSLARGLTEARSRDWALIAVAEAQAKAGTSRRR